MRIKFVEKLFLIANLIFILGVTISVILFNRIVIDLNNAFLLLLPYIVLLIIALVLITILIKWRSDYLITVKQHLSSKALNLNYISITLFFFNVIVASFMFILGIIFLGVDSFNNNAVFFRTSYVFIIIGIELALSFINLVLDALAKIKIKVDLTLKRAGFEKLLSDVGLHKKLETDLIPSTSSIDKTPDKSKQELLKN